MHTTGASHDHRSQGFHSRPRRSPGLHAVLGRAGRGGRCRAFRIPVRHLDGRRHYRSGHMSPGRIDTSVETLGFSADLSIATHGSHQSVVLQPHDSDVRAVRIEMRRI